MTVYFNDQEICEIPNSCNYTEYLEGQCNSLDMVFDDSEGAIKALELEKGDSVQVLEGNVDTGEMYISGIDYSGSQAAVRALSLPLSAFKTLSQSWENVTLTAVIDEVLNDTDIAVQYIDKPDFTYKEITRIEEDPLKFISGRLSLEGYGIRVKDNTAYIFDERALEKGEAVLQMTEEDFDSLPDYSTKDAKLISRVENSYKTGNGTAISTVEESGIEGRILRLNMAVDTVGDSIRFSQGMMRAANKYEYMARGSVENLDREPGEVIYLADAPKGHTGDNLIYMIKNDITGNRQTLYMRRPIDGDY
mgnify:FL=1